MVERAHLSIGEVLSLLQAEFPDVTISKIRFLESQGLLDPERTPSGYRKFYEPDIVRLRWILLQQREKFLPLRVIKDRLEESVRTGVPLSQVAVDVDERAEQAERGHRGDGDGNSDRADHAVAVADAPAAGSAADAPSASARPALDSGPTGVSLSRQELAAASGLPDRTIVELERFGLLAGRAMGPDIVYDEEALVVARIAASFSRYGIEARHLRMYKTSADREAGLFEQVILPLLKQRNPSARQRALDSLNELARLGDGLRAAMLRHALGQQF